LIIYVSLREKSLAVEDVRHPLAVEAVPVALVGQVLKSIGRGFGQLEHVYDGETLYLWNNSN
jgi:hypothetical protein